MGLEVFGFLVIGEEFVSKTLVRSYRKSSEKL